MCKSAQNKWEAVRLQKGKEFESFHFKPQTGIDNENNNVGNFGKIDHGADIIRTFDDGDALFFVGSESDGAVDLLDFVLGEVFDQGSYEGGFTALAGALNDYSDGGVGLDLLIRVEVFFVEVSFFLLLWIFSFLVLVFLVLGSILVIWGLFVLFIIVLVFIRRLVAHVIIGVWFVRVLVVHVLELFFDLRIVFLRVWRGLGFRHLILLYKIGEIKMTIIILHLITSIIILIL